MTNRVESETVPGANHPLQLEAPSWHYGSHRPEANSLGGQIVDHLVSGNAINIVSQVPYEIAFFTARRVDMLPGLGVHTMFNSDLAESTLHEAARRDIDLGVVSSINPQLRHARAFRAMKFAPEVGIAPRLVAALRGTDAYRLIEQSPPKYLLHMTILDYFQGKSHPDLFPSRIRHNEIRHSIKLMPPGKFDRITYSYFNYGI